MCEGASKQNKTLEFYRAETALSGFEIPGSATDLIYKVAIIYYTG